MSKKSTFFYWNLIQICAFDSGFDATTGNLESIIFVLLGWVIFAFCLYIIVYRLFKTNQTIKEDVEDELDGKKKNEDVQVNSDLVKKIGNQKAIFKIERCMGSSINFEHN